MSRLAGKIAIVIYGLKAYVDQSAVVGREVQRLRRFEEALESGGVIEQLVQSEEGASLASEELEPVLHVGDDVLDPGPNETEQDGAHDDGEHALRVEPAPGELAAGHPHRRHDGDREQHPVPARLQAANLEGEGISGAG